MVARLSHTTINCSNAFELSAWWKQVLDFVDVEGDPNEAGDEECVILDPDGDQRLLFIEVDELQDPVGRIHFDLASRNASRDDEVERILALGATEVADRRRADGSGWVVLADPAGNRFCVVRSDAERAPDS
jgi:catechol 2,3-dioxygenase-like lactoylglutathione lyase family enzyme